MIKTSTKTQSCLLQEIIDRAKPGESIQIPHGVYHTNKLILKNGGDEKNPIIIEPCPGDHVVFRGDAPLPGDWEKFNTHVWRMKIPLNYSYPVGELFSCEKILNEVTSLEQLQENTWGYFSANPFPTKPPLTTDTKLITCDEQYVFDLDKLADNHKLPSQRHILQTFVYVPTSSTGSLHLDNTEHINGQWPMALVNNFYGLRRADEPFGQLKQPIAITLNGNQLNDWNLHSPLLKNVPWQAGWNELIIQLDAEAGRKHCFKLTASTHHWSVDSEEGFYASPTKKKPDILPNVKKGLVLKSFLWHNPAPETLESVGCLEPQSLNNLGRFVYLHTDANQHPADLNITASQQSCLLTHGEKDCSHVIIRDLHFQRTASSPKHGMIELGSKSSHWQIENCTFDHSTGGCINIDTGKNHHITACNFKNVGCTAIQAWAPKRQRNRHLKISACHFSHCNTKNFGLGWHAACIKICRSAQCIIEYCEMQDNACHGIWLDWECEGNWINANTLTHCKGSGIFLEASRWNNRITYNHISYTAVGPFGGNGIYMHDTSDSYIAHNVLNHNADFGLRFGLATNRVLDFNIPMRRDGNIIIHNQMCSNGTAAMDVSQESPGQCMNYYDHNIYMPAKFIVVHHDDINKVFNAETGQSPVVRRFEINSLAELQHSSGQDANSRDQIRR